VGLSTPLYLGKSILADFGAYEFRCPLVFLARFPAVESSPEFLLCMSSIDAANFVVCSIEAYTDFANFFHEIFERLLQIGDLLLHAF
jgi:hypothetical protein